jgi:hypothetical protein
MNRKTIARVSNLSSQLDLIIRMKKFSKDAFRVDSCEGENAAHEYWATYFLERDALLVATYHRAEECPRRYNLAVTVTSTRAEENEDTLRIFEREMGIFLVAAPINILPKRTLGHAIYHAVKASVRNEENLKAGI